MDNRKEIEELAILLSESKSIVLIGHTNPDGDCIGAITGMIYFLRNAGYDVMAVVPTGYPDFLSFLVEEGSILVAKTDFDRSSELIARADLIICVDFNSLSRIDDLGKVVEKSKAKKVLVDHHPQPEGNFNIMFSEVSLSSASEFVYWIIKGLSGYLNTAIPQRSRVSLYTGMMTDTNNFSNSVVASTFKMASELLEAGVDKEFVQQQVFGGFSEGRMRMMGYMLYDNMRIIPHLHASVMVITKEIKERFGFSDGDSEGFVNLGLNIKDVYVSALFTETESEDYVRVSLRSKGDFSVNALSKAYFNGGGHERAAGGRLKIDIGDVSDYFEESMEKYMKDNALSL